MRHTLLLSAGWLGALQSVVGASRLEDATRLAGIAGVLGTLTVLQFTPILVLSLFGVRVSKWLQNIGGTTQILMFSALILVPFIALSRGTVSEYHPITVAMPAFTLLSLNIFGKMAVGALSGFEYVAILAGECRNPARSISRTASAWALWCQWWNSGVAISHVSGPALRRRLACTRSPWKRLTAK